MRLCERIKDFLAKNGQNDIFVVRVFRPVQHNCGSATRIYDFLHLASDFCDEVANIVHFINLSSLDWNTIAKVLILTAEVIFVFGLVILFHEFGHFIIAKLAGVGVPEFAFGIGPEIIGYKKGETRYKICAFPIGGYVKLVGDESDNSLDAYGEKSFRQKSAVKKMSIIFAGPLMNYILAIFLFAFVYYIWGIPKTITTKKTIYQVIIENVHTNSPADKAAIKSGDIVISVNGEKIEKTEEFVKTIRTNSNRKVFVTINRAGKIIEKQVIPKSDKRTKKGMIGVILSNVPVIPRVVAKVEPNSIALKTGIKQNDIIITANNSELPTDTNRVLIKKDIETEFLIERKHKLKNFRILDNYLVSQPLSMKQGYYDSGIQLMPVTKQISLIKAFSLGFQSTYMIVATTFDFVKMMIKREMPVSGVTGPVGIIRYTVKFAKEGIKKLVEFTALINIQLAIVNLIPFPALDGSRIFLHLIEGIRRKPLNPKFENTFHYAGFVILIALILFLTYRDIFNPF